MKTVIEMALESGVAFDSEEYPEIWQTYMDVGRKELERFAELVRADAIADERESCAKVCDRVVMGKDPNDIHSDSQWAALTLAAEIRARGQV